VVVHVATHVFQVIVLASCADAFLGVDGTLQFRKGRVGINRP
jgi:hypothetical protein